MTVMTVKQLAQLLGAELKQTAADLGKTVCLNKNSIDTRTIRPGETFWALPGQSVDGHQFVADAFNKGSSAAIVSRHQTEIAGSQLIVPDVLTALQKLATWHREQQDALLIGITGSVGKTTTREMLYQVLSSRFEGMQSIGNFNNELGTPLSLLGLLGHHEFGLLEMAATRPGNIAQLCQWVQPEIGILTQIAPTHLEQFGSLDNLQRTKAELLTAVPASGLVILPEHLVHLPNIRKQTHSRVISCGSSETADVRLENARYQAGRFQFVVNGEHYQLATASEHFLNSALLSIAVASELEMSPQQIQSGFNRFRPVTGRCSLKKMGRWQIIDDSYNASPLAMKGALQTLNLVAGKQHRIAVLGDMLSLGDEATRYHRKLGQDVCQSGVDLLIAYGRHAADVAHGAYRAGMSGSRIAVCESFELIPELLSLWLETDSCLLVKGSRGMQMERLYPLLEQLATTATGLHLSDSDEQMAA